MGLLQPRPKAPLMLPPAPKPEVCDRCGHASMYCITVPGHGVIWLCGHHSHEHWDYFLEHGYGIRLV